MKHSRAHFLALMALVVAVPGRAAELCQAPWESICAPGAAEEQAEKDFQKKLTSLKRKLRSDVFRQASSETGLKPRPEYQEGRTFEEAMELELQEPENWRVLLRTLKMAENKAIAEVATQIPGFSWAELQKKFGKLRELEAGVVASELPLSAETARKMAADLRATQLLGAVDLDRSSMIWYNELCGSDGMTRQMYANSVFSNGRALHSWLEDRSHFEVSSRLPRGQKLVRMEVWVCPGQILELLRGESELILPELLHVMGHELGHHVHAIKNWDVYGILDASGKPIDRNYVSDYREMISCLNRGYSADLPLLPVPDSVEQDFRLILGRTPNGVDYKSPEVTADYWGAQTQARFLLAEVDPSARERVLRRGLRRLCEQTKPGPYHPVGKFRIEAILRVPSLRAALGCGQPAKAGCGFAGEE